MVRHQKMLLPAHEDVLALREVGYRHGNTLAHLLAVLPKGRELAPVIQVNLLRSAPALVSSQEVITTADNFALEICRQGWVVLCQACSGKFAVISQYVAIGPTSETAACRMVKIYLP